RKWRAIPDRSLPIFCCMGFLNFERKQIHTSEVPFRMKMKFRSPHRAVIATFVIATFLAVTAVLLATHSWGGYHWARTANPFTLKLGDNLTTADWKGHLSQTSQDWNDPSSPLQTAIVTGTSGKRCRMVAGTTQVCNGSYGNNGWLGLATINITGGTHITQ